MTNKSTVNRPRLVIGISSRALFDLDEAHAVYEKEGTEAYCKYQIERENEILKPGHGFGLVTKLLAINKAVNGPAPVEVLLLSRNSADSSLRSYNSIAHYGLDIKKGAFCSGKSAHEFIPAFGVHLFLSTNKDDVRNALDAGYAAATILCGSNSQQSDELRIAFDVDSVLVSDSSERVFSSQGLNAFLSHEQENAKNPLPDGPLKIFAECLSEIQKLCGDDQKLIRTAIVTARAAPAHERVIRTLRSWGITINDALFLGGMEKGPFLNIYGADVFFDDQQQHCDSAALHNISSAHVPHGIKNEVEALFSAETLS